MKDENKDFLIINNVRVPIPAVGLEIGSAIGVDSGRNAKNQVVGQVVGRRQWKLSNLSWKGLKEEQIAEIMKALEPFYVKVTFRDVTGEVHTHTMYPGDTSGKPLDLRNGKYSAMEDFHFNLIDCGWDD